MSATRLIVSFAAPSPRAEVEELGTPLSELATANRQRDALYTLSERLHRARSAETIYSAALAAIVVVMGVTTRRMADARLSEWTERQAVPTVALAVSDASVVADNCA